MADAGLFIGWGAPVRGREAKGLEVFNETLTYFGACRKRARSRVSSRSFSRHMVATILLRGSEERLAQLRVDDEFVRLSTRASLIVEGVGVIGAALGDGLEDSIATYQQAITDLI